jgi:transposase
MSKRPRVLRAQRKIIGAIEIVNPDAAGIDAGSETHWVSVPQDRSEQPVRAFGTFTADLNALADWLAECGITTVAIEATGVYWIPLFEILEQRGLNPRLVDSRSIGRRHRKTDVLDCQWLRQLHTHGLLDGAFRPEAAILPLRAYMRQRRMLIGYASDHIRHMQKALDQMNLKLHLVIDDITGVTGMRILRAIVAGQHDPQRLAAMRDRRCQNSEAVIAKALTGNYRPEHLFALSQALELFDQYRTRIAECDAQIEAALEVLDKKADRATLSKKPQATRRKNQPRFDARTLLYERAGVDLTAIDGLEASTILTITSETGFDMSAWATDGKFLAWMNLAPNKPQSGKRPLVKKPPLVHPNRAAQAFRLAAQTLERCQCALGAFFRRIKVRSGRAVAIKASAAKLATIFYTMLKNQTEYHDPGVSYYEQRYRDRFLKSLKKQAAAFGMQLVPVE